MATPVHGATVPYVSESKVKCVYLNENNRIDRSVKFGLTPSTTLSTVSTPAAAIPVSDLNINSNFAQNNVDVNLVQSPVTPPLSSPNMSLPTEKISPPTQVPLPKPAKMTGNFEWTEENPYQNQFDNKNMNYRLYRIFNRDHKTRITVVQQGSVKVHIVDDIHESGDKDYEYACALIFPAAREHVKTVISTNQTHDTSGDTLEPKQNSDGFAAGELPPESCRPNTKNIVPLSLTV